MNTFARVARASLLVLFVAACTVAFAEKHALLIGIDQYQDSDRITSLGGAAADAKGLAKTLREVGKFEDVRVLTSEDTNKPTRSSIIFEVEQLADRVKPGDLVLFVFSGHGVQLNGTSYLVPYDCDMRTDLTLQASSLPASTLLALFGKMPAGVLIDCFDMCRNDPHKGGSRGDTPNLLSEKQARDLVLVPAASQGGQSGPDSVVTLFACQAGQRSWEWPGKKRGIFSLCLENAFRGGADDQGQVRLQKLLGLLGSSVEDVAKKELNQQQRPRVEISAPAGFDVTLADGLTPGPSDSTHPSTTNAEYDAAIKRANELYDDKRYDAAEEKFAEAYTLKPNAYAMFWQGRCAYMNDKYDHALDLLTKAAELDPKYGPTYSNFGWIYIAKGDLDKAEENFKKAAELGPAGITWMNLAECEIKVKKLDEADEDFKKALEADPQNSPNTNRYGVFLLDYRNNPVAAEGYFKKAAEIDPKNARPVGNLGYIREVYDHNPAAAMTLFEKAIEIDPTYSYGMGRLGNLKLESDPAKAKELLTKATDLDPKNDFAWNALGVAFWNEKNYTEAERDFRKAAELDQKDGTYLANLAGALLRLNRKGEAIVEAKKALDLGYKDHWVFKELGLGGL
ncbi:MAG TPA: tetratricopeptide repeat protein [Fimbriimonadaceae bacterium]|nr:tetratricopeptide repeat protein [Fimbriimonadaceae bacterium]